MTRPVEMTMFVKTLSMAGGGLALFVLAATSGSDLGLTVTDSLFDLGL